jgi:hypothetical protein
MTILVNLYAGPGAGKSTLATGVFSALKMQGVNAEYVPEFAKEITWQNRLHILQNQLLVSGTQIQRVLDLKDKVDVIVTDSPMAMGRFYTDCNLTSLAVSEQARAASLAFSELNYYIRRDDTYLRKGRTQSRSEASELDEKIHAFLSSSNIPHKHIRKTREDIERIVNDVFNLRQRDADTQVSQEESKPVPSFKLRGRSWLEKGWGYWL